MGPKSKKLNLLNTDSYVLFDCSIDIDSQFYYARADKPHERMYQKDPWFMYVCLCHGLSEKMIKEIIEQKGCRQIKTLQKDCSAGKDCGSCLFQLKQILKEYEHTCDESPVDDEDTQTKRQA